jgi:hypothetical protein
MQQKCYADFQSRVRMALPVPFFQRETALVSTILRVGASDCDDVRENAVRETRRDVAIRHADVAK